MILKTALILVGGFVAQAGDLLLVRFSSKWVGKKMLKIPAGKGREMRCLLAICTSKPDV
jgi:hypothetical protein